MTSPIERRRAERLGHRQLPEGTCGRIRPGHPVRIVDLSENGVRIETARRLLPGSSVDFVLESGVVRHATRAQVVRCDVRLVRADSLLFHGGLEFATPIQRPG